MIPLIPDVGNLYLLSFLYFFFINLTKVLSILLVFQEPSLVSLIFCSILLTSALSLYYILLSACF